MYIPTAYRIEETASLLSFMRQYSFATLVSNAAGQLFASHLPLVVEQHGEQIVLRGHFAKANPHWRNHQQPNEVLVIFQGPHAYISPSQYAAHESVPTWNYVAVHAYGELQLLTAGDETLATLDALFQTFAANDRQQWESLPEKYRNGMLNGIVAFEINLSRLEGKAKLSQNRPVEDQTRVADWLLAHDDALEQEVGRLMRENVTQQ